MQFEFNQGETVYLIDTSALIILESTFKYDNPVFAAIWEEIEELIGKGCFKTLSTSWRMKLIRTREKKTS